jgi:hypothetical protein
VCIQPVGEPGAAARVLHILAVQVDLDVAIEGRQPDVGVDCVGVIERLTFERGVGARAKVLADRLSDSLTKPGREPALAQ